MSVPECWDNGVQLDGDRSPESQAPDSQGWAYSEISDLFDSLESSTPQFTFLDVPALPDVRAEYQELGLAHGQDRSWDNEYVYANPSPWLFIPEPQLDINGIYNDGHQPEPNQGIDLAGLQPSYLNQDFAALIGNVEAPDAGEGANPPEKFQCERGCRGEFKGPHQCVRNGRSLTISCLGGNNCSLTFKARNEFNRHFNTVHLRTRRRVSRTLFECPFPDCSRVGERGFPRKDNLLQHRRLIHREEIPQVKYRFGRSNGGSEVQRNGSGSMREPGMEEEQ